MKNENGFYILCHNDQDTVPLIIEELISLNLNDSLKITFVDDFSSDQTLDLIKSSPFRVIANTCNLGYGGSIKMITRDALQSDMEYFGIFPGDLQRRLTDLINMLKLAETGKYDVVVGTKYHFKDNNPGPVRRQFGNFLITNLCRLFFNKNIKDPLAGFKVYKVDSAYRIIFNCSSRFGFDIDYLFWSEFNSYDKYYYEAEVSYLRHKSSITNVQTQGIKFLLRIMIYFVVKILFKLINLKNT